MPTSTLCLCLLYFAPRSQSNWPLTASTSRKWHCTSWRTSKPMPHPGCATAAASCVPCLTGEVYLTKVASAQWRDKGDQLYMSVEHLLPAARIQEALKRPPNQHSARHDGLLTQHQLSYLNGGGGGGKTMRAIKLFRQRHPALMSCGCIELIYCRLAGSVVTHLRYGGIFNNYFTTNLLMCLRILKIG